MDKTNSIDLLQEALNMAMVGLWYLEANLQIISVRLHERTCSYWTSLTEGMVSRKFI